MSSSSSSAVSSPRPLPFLPPGLTAEQLQRLVDAEFARRKLFEFAKFTAPAEYNWGQHHTVLYSWLNDFALGLRKRIIIEMPPRHGKSEGTSRRLPPFLLGTVPGSRIVLASHTADLAEEMSRDVRQVVDSDRYRDVFPSVRLHVGKRDRDRADLFDVTGDGSFKAVGVGGGLSGRGFTHGIIDDYVKDRQQANSPTQREAVWRWYTSVFHTRQAKNAAILITATRWHEDDLIGRLKKKVDAGESEPFDVLTLPALATDKPHPDDWRKPGEALWPWFRDAAAWEQRRLLEPRDFHALDQQDPRAEGGTEWDSSLFPPSIWFDEWPKDLLLLVFGLDPSKGKSAKHGDYSAIVALGRTRDGTLWVEADLARRTTTRILHESMEFVERIAGETGKPADGFGVESDQFQELLADQLAEQQAKKWFAQIVYKMLTGGVPKDVRIRRLTPDLVARKLRFRANPGTRLLVRQMQEFPVGDHDDGPDGLEYARRLAMFLWNGKRGSK